MTIIIPKVRFVEELADPVLTQMIPLRKFRSSTKVGHCVDCGSPGVAGRVLKRDKYPSLCSGCYLTTSKQDLADIHKQGAKSSADYLYFAGTKGGGFGVLIAAERGGYFGIYLPPRRYELEQYVSDQITILRNETQEGVAIDFTDFLRQTLGILLENPNLAEKPFGWGWLQANDMHKTVAALRGVNVDPNRWTLFAPEKLTGGKASLSVEDWGCVKSILDARAQGETLKVSDYLKREDNRTRALRDYHNSDNANAEKRLNEADAALVEMEDKFPFLPEMWDAATIKELVG